MKDSEKLNKIIQEELQKIGTEVDKHAADQVKARLDRMARDGDITKAEEAKIRGTLDKVIAHDFGDRDYGIFLGSFVPNPNSMLYTDRNQWNPGIPFYEININGKDSTGDEMWAIVRNGRLKTVMLRKSLQRRSADKERFDDGGLGVETPIFDFDVYLQKIEQEQQKKEAEKLRQQQAQTKKQEELKKLKQIQGVWWKVDDEKEVVHQKNKPEKFIRFNDILDYPNWDDDTKEDLINRIN